MFRIKPVSSGNFLDPQLSGIFENKTDRHTKWWHATSQIFSAYN